MAFRVRIHRGAAQVGGSCIELECSGQRLLLDLGMPLDAAAGEVPVPDVPGLLDGGRGLLGVVLSHLHADPCGLVAWAAPGLPVAMGKVGAKILREAGSFNPRAPAIHPTWPLAHRPNELHPMAFAAPSLGRRSCRRGLDGVSLRHAQA